MVIDGVSQTTGMERLVELSAADAGVNLVIRDRKSSSVLAQVTVSGDSLVNVLAEKPKGPQSIACEAGQIIEVEVRRNEVMLTIGGPDAAVGLDDLMDAVGSLPS